MATSPGIPASGGNPLLWTLREIARLERGDLRPPRLTEPDQERWLRVRRKLGWVAFVELVHENLAEAFPTAFALDRRRVHGQGENSAGPTGDRLGTQRPAPAASGPCATCLGLRAEEPTSVHPCQ